MKGRGSEVAGFGSAKCTNEEAYLFQKMIRQGFGHNNVDHCTRLCHASSVAALIENIGSGAVTATFNEIENAELTGLVTIDQSIKLMSKGKVLLYPSLFDANSNTVREAYHHKCLPLINENVGYYENFPEEMICNNMNES